MKTTPKRAMRLMCIECVGRDIKVCASPNCKLNKPKSPYLKVIKAYCLECTGYNKKETENCTDLDCPLYPYRLGRNPRIKGLRSEKLIEEGKKFRFFKATK